MTDKQKPTLKDRCFSIKSRTLDTEVQVLAAHYHRNGISGVGFAVVDMMCRDVPHGSKEPVLWKQHRAVVFTSVENGDRFDKLRVAVTTADPNDCYRGDYFAEDLIKFLDKFGLFWA